MNKVGILILALMAAALLQSPGARPEPVDPIDTIEVIQTPLRNPDVDNRARAELANTTAAADAASSLAAAMRLDLDIRLPGHTLVLIAGSR